MDQTVAGNLQEIAKRTHREGLLLGRCASRRIYVSLWEQISACGEPAIGSLGAWLLGNQAILPPVVRKSALRRHLEKNSACDKQRAVIASPPCQNTSPQPLPVAVALRITLTLSKQSSTRRIGAL